LHQGGFGRGGKSTAAVQGFASGGTVGGPRGAPQLAVVHGGERILPASRASVTAGGATYNIVVNAPVGTSPAEVGATVIDAIRQYERVAGRAWRTA
jgi:hypothetical protein